jgi:hypothetical protein
MIKVIIQQTPAENPKAEWHDLRIERKDNTKTLYCDNKLIDTYKITIEHNTKEEHPSDAAIFNCYINKERRKNKLLRFNY